MDPGPEPSGHQARAGGTTARVPYGAGGRGARAQPTQGLNRGRTTKWRPPQGCGGLEELHTISERRQEDGKGL